MAYKSTIEMEQYRVTKITRALIRLKHSLAADIEINDVLPATLLEFEKGLQNGELKTVSAELLESLLES